MAGSGRARTREVARATHPSFPMQRLIQSSPVSNIPLVLRAEAVEVEAAAALGWLPTMQRKSYMSMEICVLSDTRLDSVSEWQKALDAEGFAVRLSDDEPFAEISGFLPASLRDKQTGFECYHVDPREMIDTYDNVQFGREWKYALVFVWGGDFTEMQAAWMAATAYARATSGIVFDPQASQLLTASQAFEVVQDNERALR